MRHVEISIGIAASVDRVWDVMFDAKSWHEWTPSITSITYLAEGPLKVGSKVLIRQPKFPQAMWTVTAIEVQKSFTWINQAPGLKVFAHHIVETTNIGSRVTLSLEYHGPFGALLARLTKRTTERYLVLEANGLKARSETPSFRFQDSN